MNAALQIQLPRCDRRCFTDTVLTAEGVPVLWTIFAILLVLWLLGLVSSYTLGGYIHLLLLLALVVVIVRVLQGRPAV
jgi:hypothetical protein